MKDLLTQESIDFISGSAAGALSIVVGQPFDTIKVRLQTNSKFHGPIDCFKQLVKKEGFMGLFTGMGPPIVTSTAANAVVFTSYGSALKFLRGGETEGKASLSEMFMAGSIAGLSKSWITGPSELFKIRLQTNSNYHNSFEVMRDIFRSSGIKGVFRGYVATSYRESPSFGSYFTTYYWTLEKLGDRFGNILPSFIAGGCAGAVSWSLVYPVDIAKTIIQMNEKSSSSTLTVLKEQYGRHGWRHLYRGLGTTVIRSLPVNAVVFPVYETVSTLLNGYAIGDGEST